MYTLLHGVHDAIMDIQLKSPSQLLSRAHLLTTLQTYFSKLDPELIKFAAVP
ncbi:Hypothetical protein FKW44_014209 [Caligus rogercresseyi]|uniref:Uncharacterized protein n=1 Tax=Caligus rogercresseyi TaxID=217165 RepID=A0A7T8GYJ1_CALRO|nr:Hypothetical protein FKW44_014209 [Caligus rogercresseyi]